MAVELGDAANLFHGNHLLYGGLGWAFDRLWRAAGYAGYALHALTTLNAALSAASCAVLYDTLRRNNVPARLALASAFGCAFSYGFWLWALEAQVYPLGTLGLTLAARELFDGRYHEVPGRAVARRLAAFHALAVLGHVIHILFALPVLYRFLKKDRRPGAAFRTYAGWTAALVAGAYAAALLAWVRPAGLDGLRVWLLGSAALTPDRSFRFHFAEGFGPWTWWTTEAFALWAPPGTYGDGLARGGLWPWVLAALLAALGAHVVRVLRPKHRPELALLGLWLVPSALFFCLWEPGTLAYRNADLPALWLALGLAAARWRASPAWRLGFAGLLALWTAGHNLVFGVRPVSERGRNAGLLLAERVRDALPEDAWFAATAINPIYIPYFARKKPLVFQGRVLDRDLAAPAPRFLLDDMLADPLTLTAFGPRFAFEPYVSGGLRFVRLVPREAR